MQRGAIMNQPARLMIQYRYRDGPWKRCTSALHLCARRICLAANWLRPDSSTPHRPVDRIGRVKARDARVTAKIARAREAGRCRERRRRDGTSRRNAGSIKASNQIAGFKIVTRDITPSVTLQAQVYISSDMCRRALIVHVNIRVRNTVVIHCSFWESDPSRGRDG